MKYNGKDIGAMTDLELSWTKTAVDDQYADVMAKRENPKFKAKFHGQPPPPLNVAFMALKNEIDSEIEKRKNNV